MGICSYKNKDNIITITPNPNIITITPNPNIITLTPNPNIITLTPNPNIIKSITNIIILKYNELNQSPSYCFNKLCINEQQPKSQTPPINFKKNNINQIIDLDEYIYTKYMK